MFRLHLLFLYFLNENEKHRRIDFKLISPKENSNSYKSIKFSKLFYTGKIVADLSQQSG